MKDQTQKLTLDALKVASFVTRADARKVNGGATETQSMGHTLCEGADCTVRHCAAY